MPISETQHSLVQFAQSRTEALLSDPNVSHDLLDDFNLPSDVQNRVRDQLAAAQDKSQRVRAFLKALDWLAPTAPAHALGMAFAMQSYMATEVTSVGDLSPRGVLVFPGSSQILFAVAFALVGAGAFEELLSMSDQFVSDLRRYHMPLNAEAFQVAAAEAENRLGRPARARALLPDRTTIERAAAEQDAQGFHLPAAPLLVRRDNLEHELSHQESAAIAETRPFRERSAKILAETVEAVSSLLTRNGVSTEKISEALRKIEATARASASKSDMIQAVELLAVLEEILGPLVPGLPPKSPGLRVATAALASSDPSVGDAALKELSQLENEKLAAGDLDGWLAYSWQKSLILERNGRYEETLYLLERISLERKKLAGSAPSMRERAGISSSFRDLAQRTAALHLKLSGRADAAFEAIEAGKAQWLGEAGSTTSPDLGRFRGTVANQRVHYLTYAVGSDATVAVFVPAHSEPLCAEIPIGHNAIVKTAHDLVHKRGFRQRLAGNLAERLGRLTDWLPAPAADGPIRLGDVLIVAPHSALHSLPLHALPSSDGHPLAPRLAVVRSHGAALVERTARKPVSPIVSALALRAEAESEPLQERRKASFDELVRELRSICPCDTLEGVEADFDRLRAALRPRQLVHLFAHGDAMAYAPYSSSGLLLASQGSLPIRGWKTFHTDHLVSPERIALAQLSETLSGGHVTLQACVSGHAIANLRGDAIGLEWSLLLSDASSVLAAHWHVDFESSTEFCRRFYHNWLVCGASRAEAWRLSAQAFVEAGDTAAWAAFSLTGDWR